MATPEPVQKLSEIIQREDEQQAQVLQQTVHRKNKERNLKSLLKNFVINFHNKLCSECECRNQQPECTHNNSFTEAFQKSFRGFSRSRHEGDDCQRRTIRLATLNVALFSLAPVVPETKSFSSFNPTYNSASPTPPLAVLLMEPISPTMDVARALESDILSQHRHRHRAKMNPAFSPNPFYSFHSSPCIEFGNQLELNKNMRRTSILEVLRDSQADLIALQEVKAEEAKGMSPLSDLAEALGMHFAYAESWAPEFGNAILSRWPIKSSSIKRIHNTSDYRNLLQVVVEVPSFGEVRFSCTHLDHLDEDWRLKQVSSILEDCKKQPHFLVGNLNSLNRSDYSEKRWLEIARFRAENRKMAPRGDVMERLLVENGYLDAATASDSDIPASLVNGQETQGTCKHNTRIDYILASPTALHGFVPGSYKVLSSKGTSDHHLVTVDIANISTSQKP